ncbi:CDP-alcohol phosphatidyltransferase family protein [Paenibacillus contaminans]|uniref:Phosphatidylglycerophosphate synthase n=1 Tax=Paenibacillus contaminans TaxID=450362 RepID=A0A329MBA0_9BACL|nr:CDP-alcohol phosphatidyltransferase family protein [Paenibacillus contaminans]RAV17375.1 CDP-diacylglycerol--glycerol-3-phosphate 3-phosphatidyltransferase [Paenibacillus contaminans]
MNLPNLLTGVRFVLIPIYLSVFFEGYVKLAFVVLLIAGITDVLDGYLARKRKQITEIGSMLDPLADKCMMLAVMASLLISEMIPWSAAIAMLIRDAGMIAGSAFFHFRGKKTVPANTMGKLTTVLYYIAIWLIVFEVPYAITYLWFVITFSFLTSFIYIFKFKTLNRGQGAQEAEERKEHISRY